VKAIVVREFGPPEVMRLEEVPTPTPGAGEVLIRVKAVSVNRTLDLVVRSGKYAMPVKLPHVLGVDPSGVVEAVGPDVSERKVGDRVVTLQYLKQPTPNAPPAILGVHGWGGYAEYVKVPAALTRLIPPGVDFPAATVVARHAPTAFSLWWIQFRRCAPTITKLLSENAGPAHNQDNSLGGSVANLKTRERWAARLAELDSSGASK